MSNRNKPGDIRTGRLVIVLILMSLTGALIVAALGGWKIGIIAFISFLITPLIPLALMALAIIVINWITYD